MEIMIFFWHSVIFFFIFTAKFCIPWHSLLVQTHQQRKHLFIQSFNFFNRWFKILDYISSRHNHVLAPFKYLHNKQLQSLSYTVEIDFYGESHLQSHLRSNNQTHSMRRGWGKHQQLHIVHTFIFWGGGGRVGHSPPLYYSYTQQSCELALLSSYTREGGSSVCIWCHPPQEQKHTQVLSTT